MDTSKPYSDIAELLPMLILHSQRRDRALGLPRSGARTLNLLDYRRRQERASLSNLTQAAFLKSVIDECRAEVRRLIDGADTPEKRREILPEVERLGKLAEGAAVKLETLTNG